MVDVSLNYTTGLSRYFGLAELAIEFGIWKKVGTRLELKDGSKIFLKKLLADPARYFTPEILDAIDEGVGKKFRYGSALDLKQMDDHNGAATIGSPQQAGNLVEDLRRCVAPAID